MPDITIDMTGDQTGEPDSLNVDIAMDEHGLSDYHVRIAGLHILLNHEQLEGVYSAIKPWFEDSAA